MTITRDHVQERAVKEPGSRISDSRKRHFIVSIGVGIVIGVVMGMIFYRENIALYLVIGVIIGAIYGLFGTPGNR